MNDIRNYAIIAEADKETITKKLMALKSKHIKAETKVIRSQIDSAEKRLVVIKTAIKNLYIDKCSGNLPEEVFKSMMEDFLTEQENIENRIPQLKKGITRKKSNATDEVNEWIRLIGQFSNADKLDRNIITQLIDSITVSERKQVDGRWEQSIDIEYRFIGNVLNESEKQSKKRTLLSS
ncbi:MAG: DUF4368 domain-containing protein [Clostridiales bacterium]|nr:MAG: DUF4368 domain-containing protein [Clostridiales bacterium]